MNNNVRNPQPNRQPVIKASLGLIFGAALGLILGSAAGSQGLGLVFGAGGGLILGAALDRLWPNQGGPSKN